MELVRMGELESPESRVEKVSGVRQLISLDLRGTGVSQDYQGYQVNKGTWVSRERGVTLDSLASAA